MLQRLCIFGALAALTVTGALYTRDASADALRSMPPATVEGEKNLIVEQFIGLGTVAHRVVASPWSSLVADAVCGGL